MKELSCATALDHTCLQLSLQVDHAVAKRFGTFHFLLKIVILIKHNFNDELEVLEVGVLVENQANPKARMGVVASVFIVKGALYSLRGLLVRLLRLFFVLLIFILVELDNIVDNDGQVRT